MYFLCGVSAGGRGAAVGLTLGDGLGHSICQAVIAPLHSSAPRVLARRKRLRLRHKHGPPWPQACQAQR